jgi:hypothetical protein
MELLMVHLVNLDVLDVLMEVIATQVELDVPCLQYLLQRLLLLLRQLLLHRQRLYQALDQHLLYPLQQQIHLYQQCVLVIGGSI